MGAGAVGERATGGGGLTGCPLAAHRGHASVVELLLRAEADPLRRNNNGVTPLDLAIHFNHAAVVALPRARIAEMQMAH